MQKTRIFETAEGQAVEIPAEFEFSADEVYVERDPQTGALTLSEKPLSEMASGDVDTSKLP